MTVFAAENVRDWRGKPVIDPSGARIGRHRLVFVPLVRATVRPAALWVQFAKKLVGDGPSIDTDGELAAAAEPAVFSHYGLPAGNDGVRRLARR